MVMELSAMVEVILVMEVVGPMEEVVPMEEEVIRIIGRGAPTISWMDTVFFRRKW